MGTMKSGQINDDCRMKLKSLRRVKPLLNVVKMPSQILNVAKLCVRFLAVISEIIQAHAEFGKK